MAGKASLPVKVEIGFSAGPLDTSVVWTDVSAWVQRSKTISCSRSVDAQTLTPGDGRGQVRLSNPDGRFTLGATGAFGLIRNRLPVRISQGSGIVWTGLAEKWTAGVDGIRPVVDLTLVDRWPRMRQRVLTGDRLRQVHQALGAADLWPMTDPPGSAWAESATPGSMWRLVEWTLGLPSWRAAANPQGGTLDQVAVYASSGLLGADMPGPIWTPGIMMGGVTLSGWVNLTAAAMLSFTLDDAANGLQVGLTRSAGVTTAAVTFGRLAARSVTLPDTGWAHLCATMPHDGSDGALYVNGRQIATLALYPAGVGVFEPLRDLKVGALGGFGYVARWDRPLGATEVAAIAAAGLDALGQTGDAPDVRASRAAALWPPTTLTTRGAFAATMSKQAVDGVSQADLLAACAVTEGGMLHLDTSGWPVLSARGYRTEAALACTIPAAVVENTAQWELDDLQLVNVSTVERMALAESVTSVTRRNDASVATYGEVTSSVQGWWDTDVQAVDRANTEVNMWSEAAPRSRSFTVDLMTCGASVDVGSLLAADIGDRIQVTNLPDQLPAVLGAEVLTANQASGGDALGNTDGFVGFSATLAYSGGGIVGTKTGSGSFGALWVPVTGGLTYSVSMTAESLSGAPLGSYVMWRDGSYASAGPDSVLIGWTTKASASSTVRLQAPAGAVWAAIVVDLGAAVPNGSQFRITALSCRPVVASGWYIDGIDDQITEASWKRTFTVSPALDFWSIDDATFGGLDEWPLG